MCLTVTPLAVSMHAPNEYGYLHCFSLHNKAINLINQNQKIVTLHSYNSGISPMGWLFKKNDFDYIRSIIMKNTAVYQQKNGNLIIGDICLVRQYRQFELNCKNRSIIDSAIVSKFLKPINMKTGLFGPLNDNVDNKLPIGLKKFIEQFLLLLTQKPYDLKSYLGLGPGLTPSYDDMIVGILAVLHSEKNLDKSFLSQSINLPTSQLEQLTTKVSATFLQYAIQGIFTSSLLAVISLIRQYRSNSLVIKKLIDYGHTSGMDLLLGIWLGTLILEEFYLNK